MSWGVTTTDVLNTTGVSATAAQLAQADAVVTIYVNRTPPASAAMSPRDLFWIYSAIQWQTVWQAQQPNYVGRNQYDQLSQDGMSVLTDAQWAKILSPIAARALKNLSFKGSRTIRPLPIDIPRGSLGVAAFELEIGDAYTRWDGPLHM